jgi:hypothetical protein
LPQSGDRLCQSHFLGRHIFVKFANVFVATFDPDFVASKNSAVGFLAKMANNVSRHRAGDPDIQHRQVAGDF